MVAKTSLKSRLGPGFVREVKGLAGRVGRKNLNLNGQLQTPPVHVKPTPHAAPSLAGTLPHAPPTGSQLSIVHGLRSLQVLAVPLHAPWIHCGSSTQPSVTVHVLPSGKGAASQAPVWSLQVAVVHGLPVSQALNEPKHRPDWHLASSTQAPDAMQGVPSTEAV
jgi:hypothetical protein